eukprot:scaffold14497_cov116-Isochrysis_galbana.AAC.1
MTTSAPPPPSVRLRSSLPGTRSRKEASSASPTSSPGSSPVVAAQVRQASPIGPVTASAPCGKGTGESSSTVLFPAAPTAEQLRRPPIGEPRGQAAAPGPRLASAPHAAGRPPAPEIPTASPPPPPALPPRTASVGGAEAGC